MVMSIEEVEAEFKDKLFDFVQDVKTYDPKAQLLDSKYIDRIVEFLRWLIYFLKNHKTRVVDLESVVAGLVTSIANLADRVTTLETKADQAKATLQDHEQRITALEGGP